MDAVLRVFLYRRRAVDAPGREFAFFESRADAEVGAAATRVAAMLDAARTACCVLLACDKKLNDAVAPHLGGALAPGTWRVWSRTCIVVRLADDEGFALPWFARPRIQNVFCGGPRQVRIWLRFATAMESRCGPTTLHLVCASADRTQDNYASAGMNVVLAGAAEPVKEKLAARMRVLAIPTPNDRARARPWLDALRAPGDLLVVAPAFFMLDLLRYMLSKTSPTDANARARNAFFATFGFEAPVTAVPCLAPHDIPVADGPLVVQ